MGPPDRAAAPQGDRNAAKAAGESPPYFRGVSAMALLSPLNMDEREADDIIKLAILAVGGQGGGVLTDWITEVAERNGYLAQSTSVAGVAQRTGATIYYVEMCPDGGRRPVFALSPAQGDVDIMIAA